MLSDIQRLLEAQVQRWKDEAAGRRERIATDPGADAIESCARELTSTIASIGQVFDRVTADQYAEMHNVTVQSVRRWCRIGAVEGAEQTGTGWLIPRDAKVVLKRAG